MKVTWRQLCRWILDPYGSTTARSCKKLQRRRAHTKCSCCATSRAHTLPFRQRRCSCAAALRACCPAMQHIQLLCSTRGTENLSTNQSAAILYTIAYVCMTRSIRAAHPSVARRRCVDREACAYDGPSGSRSGMSAVVLSLLLGTAATAAAFLLDTWHRKSSTTGPRMNNFARRVSRCLEYSHFLRAMLGVTFGREPPSLLRGRRPSRSRPDQLAVCQFQLDQRYC
jgi:hypothetical protein